MKGWRRGTKERAIDKLLEMEVKAAKRGLLETSVNMNSYLAPSMGECLRAEAMNDFVRKFVYF